MIDLATKSLDIARGYIGTHEKTNHNDGPFVEMLQRWMEGEGQTWMTGQPWCACFVSWCISQAAVWMGIHPVMPKSASSSQIYAWAHMHGCLLDKPEGICIGLIRAPDGSGKTHEHTFFANALPENLPDGQDWVWSVDGNWNNSVCRPVPQHKIKDCDFVKIV